MHVDLPFAWLPSLDFFAGLHGLDAVPSMFTYHIICYVAQASFEGTLSSESRNTHRKMHLMRPTVCLGQVMVTATLVMIATEAVSVQQHHLQDDEGAVLIQVLLQGLPHSLLQGLHLPLQLGEATVQLAICRSLGTPTVQPGLAFLGHICLELCLLLQGIF